MNLKLLQLLLDNRRPDAKALSRVEAKDDDTTIYLYDPIVGSRMLAELFGYVCAQELVPSIDGVKTGTLRLRINCPGGDVFAMQAIMNSLRAASSRGVKLIAQVDGVAASAATGIASVCDEVVMEQGTQYMVHNSQGMAMGDRNELRALADLMEKVDGGLLDAYKDKTGKDEGDIRAWMDAETWFTAEEAVSNGFADRVNASGKKTRAASDWKLDAFANAPKAEAEPEINYITDEHRERQQQRLRLSRLTSS